MARSRRRGDQRARHQAREDEPPVPTPPVPSDFGGDYDYYHLNLRQVQLTHINVT